MNHRSIFAPALVIFIAAAATAQEQTWNHYGVVVTQRDVALKEAHDTCAMHPVKMPSAVPPLENASGVPSPIPSPFWPEPCGQAEREYTESGSKAKFDEIEKRDAQSQVEAVKGALAK